MNYNLYDAQKALKDNKAKDSALKKIFLLVKDEKKNLLWSFVAILVSSGLNLLGPLLIGLAIDRYVQTKQMHGVLVYSGILLIIYLLAFGANYLQMQLMGIIGQRTLYRLRNAVFNKLQAFPISFFNQNKSGDLISRINNDTQNLNQFFSQSLMRFLGFIVTIFGAGIFLLAINLELGGASLIPGVFILVFTILITPWVKRKNAESLKSVGGMSGEIQESLDNFKTIIAFNRRDYFRNKFEEANNTNYKKAIGAGLANTLLMPVYSLLSSFAQLIVLAYGIYLISQGNFTIGLLISFLAYVNRFYTPLRQMAALWASFQTALAAWDRISVILNMRSDMAIIQDNANQQSDFLLEFRNVFFSYDGKKDILENVSFNLLPGKTYAFIGPTRGGKTTSASLLARLFDPVSGRIFLNGRDIRTFNEKERSQKIGFILQEPFLFSGTIKENILVGNEKFRDYSDNQLIEVLGASGLDILLDKFDNGLASIVTTGAHSLSLGQKQIIAFIRAILREPEILILDEATANIDTVTEKLLEDILKKLPKTTTRVVIAHRLNTIENADEIFFVNGGKVEAAGSMDNAMAMLMDRKRAS